MSEQSNPENIYETASIDDLVSNSNQSAESQNSGEQDQAQTDSSSSDVKIELTPEAVLEALSEVYDPEIPIDIVNLGLIYGVDIEGPNINIQMTMTAPGCPASTQIAGEARMVVLEMQGVENVDIEIVWDPPWDPSKMSEEAQQSMGML